MNNNISTSNKYENIINLPHPVSLRHKAMPRQNRAAQFAPFAALTGYDAAINEEARLTDVRLELDDECKARLDRKLKMIYEHLSEKPIVMITYFKPDSKKNGGAYITIKEYIEQIDTYKQIIKMADGTIIPIKEILNIDSNLFSAMYT